MNINERNAIFNENQNLIYFVINKYFKGKFDKRDDMFQIGCIALLEAIENFDESLNIKFSSYAVKYIFGKIYTGINRNSSGIKFNNNIYNALIKYYKTNKTPEEIYEELNLSPNDKLGFIQLTTGLISLDQDLDISDDGCGNYYEIVKDKNSEIPFENVIYKLDDDLLLSKREREVYNCLINNLSQSEISKYLNVSKQRVNVHVLNIKAKIINKYIKNDEFKMALELLELSFLKNKNNIDEVEDIINKYGINSKILSFYYNYKNKTKIIKQEKEDEKMENIEWPKKQVNTLITKSLIKIILANQKIPDDNNLKPLIIDTLSKNGIINIKLNDKILDISKNQILSLYAYAKNLIKKHNYIYPEQINLNNYEYDIIESIDDNVKLKDENSLSNKLLNIINKIIINNNSSKVTI